MKQQHTLQPKLRFPEFEGGWKIEQIGNIADIYDGTHQTPKYVSQGVPFVSVENINNIENSDKFITKEAFNNYKIKPRTGDILMTRITAGIIGATSIVKNDLDLAYYVSLALIRNKSENNIEFINHYISTDYFKRELHKRIIHVAFPKKINLGDINQCILKYSDSINEQQKIADYLSTVDTKINLLEEKKAQLALYKKAMMQKLFSQEIRFKPTQCHTEPVEVEPVEVDINEAYPEWEEKRLGEIGELYQPKTISQNDLSKEGYLVYGANGVIGRYYEFNHEHEQIAITCRGNTCGTINYTQPKSWITGNAMVLNLDNSFNVSKKFIYYKLCFDNLNYLITGSGQPQITSDIKYHKIYLPSLLEQQKIANFLSAIDESIEKVTEQISQTQSFKKAMLQQMFV